MTYHQSIERGIELLTLCQRLQTEKDGIARPEPFTTDRTKTLDQFASDIEDACTYMASLHMLLPMKRQLADLGQQLEKQGKITVAFGDNYAQAALAYVLKEHGMPGDQDREVSVS